MAAVRAAPPGVPSRSLTCCSDSRIRSTKARSYDRIVVHGMKGKAVRTPVDVRFLFGR